MQTENSTCKCCGQELAPIYEVTPKYIYNDFDATGQEVDAIWCGEEWEIIGFPDHCLDCEIKKGERDKDDLPF